MGSGGGGGDNGMMMMMMMLMQQQQQEQMKREQAAAQFASSQRAENQNYQRYQDQITAQNKKVGDQWDLYNQNIGKIQKLNPQYTAHKAYTFNPYTVNNSYRKSTNQSEADANTENLNKWYSDLDRQSLDDFNMAKSQYEASKNWLSDVQAQQDAANRVLPGVAPGTWGAGGNQVSGGAGADSLGKDAAPAGTGIGTDNAGIYGIAGGGMPSGSDQAMKTSGTGFIDGGAGGGSSSLANVFGSAVTDKTKTSSPGYSIF